MKFTILYVLQIAIMLIQAGQDFEDVIKLYKKKEKKRKEIQKHTERNILHINSSTGDFVI